jgi:hypothetical protein
LVKTVINMLRTQWRHSARGIQRGYNNALSDTARFVYDNAAAFRPKYRTMGKEKSGRSQMLGARVVSHGSDGGSACNHGNDGDDVLG